MNLFWLSYIHLALNLFEIVKTLHTFDDYTNSEGKTITDLKEEIKYIWTATWQTFSDDVVHEDFEMILCGKSDSNASYFYARYIDGHAIPEVMYGKVIWGSQQFLDKYWKWKRDAGTTCDIHADVMKNGQRMALEFGPTRKFATYRTHQLQRAIIYNCEGEGETIFRNDAPILKLQKFFNELWMLVKVGKITEAARGYFSEYKFFFETCSQQSKVSPMKSAEKFMSEFLRSENYEMRPRILDALEVVWGNKWQADAEWGNKKMQLQWEDVDDYLLITKGREWPCEASWK